MMCSVLPTVVNHTATFINDGSFQTICKGDPVLSFVMNEVILDGKVNYKDLPC